MQRVYREDISADYLRERLLYNADTGEFRWRTRPLYPQKWNSRHAGKVAGHSSASQRYHQIRIDGHLYLGHRLAWLYVHGAWPEYEIDHINGDPADNRMVNLRPCDHSQNMHNRPVQSNSKSGLKGVSFNKQTQRWRAQIRVDGCHHHLGDYDTPEEAHEIYKKAAKALLGEFARIYPLERG